MGFLHVGQIGLTPDLQVIHTRLPASQSAGITGVSHCAQPTVHNYLLTSSSGESLFPNKTVNSQRIEVIYGLDVPCRSHIEI